MSSRRRHPLRRWWVYCFVVWALLTTAVGRALAGSALELLGQVWVREVVLLTLVAIVAAYTGHVVWHTVRQLARDVATVRQRARRRAQRRQDRRTLADTLAEIRGLPQTGRRR